MIEMMSITIIIANSTPSCLKKMPGIYMLFFFLTLFWSDNNIAIKKCIILKLFLL